MRQNIFFSLILVALVNCGYGAKILFFCPVPAHSHQKMYKEVWKEMSLRGHKVVVVTPSPAFNKSMINLTEYDISSTYEFSEKQIKPEWKVTFFNKPTFLGMILRQFVIQWFSGNGMEFLYKHPEVARLVTEHQHFDACIFEWFHPAIAVYGHIFQCPMIAIGSNSLPIQMLDSVGNPSHPITAPEQDLPIFRNEITFFQRVWSVFWAIFVRLHHKWFLIPSEDARMRKYYGDHLPYLGDLVKHIELVITNRNTVFHRPVANMPNVIELGSIKYGREHFDVDQDLRDFLDNSKQGAIYFSFGVSMHGTSMPPKYFQKIQSAFESLPYNIIWKWENATMPNKPNNVLIRKFVPQVYVLENIIEIHEMKMHFQAVQLNSENVLISRSPKRD